MPQNATTVHPVGDIARQHGVSIHQVEYVIRARDIQPTGKAGNARIFTRKQVEFIGHELRAISEQRRPLNV